MARFRVPDKQRKCVFLYVFFKDPCNNLCICKTWKYNTIKSSLPKMKESYQRECDKITTTNNDNDVPVLRYRENLTPGELQSYQS